jgi:hypothetical protein
MKNKNAPTIKRPRDHRKAKQRLHIFHEGSGNRRKKMKNNQKRKEQ